MLTDQCYIWGKNRLECEHNCKELTQNCGEGTITREDFLMKIVSKLILNDDRVVVRQRGSKHSKYKGPEKIREMQVFQSSQWKKVSKGLEIVTSDYWQE